MDTCDKCEFCFQTFNLTTHKPIIFQECLDTVCLKCVQNVVLQQKIKNNQYKCCIDLNHILNINPSNLDQLKMNPTIQRKLEKQNDQPIYCSIHPNQIAQFLIRKSNKIVCYQCISEQGYNYKEKSSVAKISRCGLKRYADQSILLLEKGIQNLENFKQKMKQVSDNNISLNQNQLCEIFQSNQFFLKNCLNDINTDIKLKQIIEQSFPINIQIKQLQSEKIVNQDFPLLKRQLIEGISMIESIFQQKIDVEVQKRSNSFLKNYITDWPQLKFKLIYQASADGNLTEDFHIMCDNKGPTVTFYLSEFGHVFGLYQFLSIKQNNVGLKDVDNQLFVFQLDKQTIHEQILCYKVQQSELDFIYIGQEELIVTNWQVNGEDVIYCITTDFGKSFKLPEGIQHGSQKSMSYLGGAEKFKIIDVEVYTIS